MFSVLAVTLVALLSVPAEAITDGLLDGEDHPYVGLMVAFDADGNRLYRCSGTLLSPTLFLTAGHCTESPAASTQIFFDADVESGVPGNGYPADGDASGTVHMHPLYDPAAFFVYDLGVVVLDAPLAMEEYGVLPELNELDALARRRRDRGATFTAVGYGLQEINPVFIEQQKVRMVSHPHLIQINGGIVKDFSLMLSNNHSTGGTCFGDSGGPNFIGDSNVIAGVTSFGLNGNCAGTGGVYRVDRADDLLWLYTAFGDELLP